MRKPFWEIEKSWVQNEFVDWARSENQWVFEHIFQSFLNSGENTFKIAAEFGEHLAKVNLDISCSHLPQEEIVWCIEFPDNLRFRENEHFFHCAFVRASSDPTKWTIATDMMLTFLFPRFDEEGNFKRGDKPFSILGVPLLKSESINLDDIFEHFTKDSEMRSLMDIGYFVLKCLVYIKSGDPDLRSYRAPKPTTENAKKIRRWLRKHEDRSLLDMTLVGYDFKKPKIYQVGETTVTGHFRWQPFGERREKVKLIWIEPHVRHYGEREQ